jgi:hypothetical protein
MMRPPTTGGRGESDFHDYDDADIEPKRGTPDTNPDSRSEDTPGQQPAEGRSDLGFPGADREDDLPERLGERLENGSSSSMATGEPDVLPDVEPPETTM